MEPLSRTEAPVWGTPDGSGMEPSTRRPPPPAAPASQQRRRGATLTEIMLAFLILATATLGSMGIMGYGHAGSAKDFRNVLALQLLENTMNQLLQQSFASMTVQMRRARQSTFNAPILGIGLGPIDQGKEKFDVVASLSMVPVTYTYRPINVSWVTPEYDPDDPTTWRFGDVTKNQGEFDGTALPYKLIKMQILVKWKEQGGRVNRQVEAISFVVDLES